MAALSRRDRGGNRSQSSASELEHRSSRSARVGSAGQLDPDGNPLGIHRSLGRDQPDDISAAGYTGQSARNKATDSPEHADIKRLGLRIQIAAKISTLVRNDPEIRLNLRRFVKTVGRSGRPALGSASQLWSQAPVQVFCLVVFR